MDLKKLEFEKLKKRDKELWESFNKNYLSQKKKIMVYGTSGFRDKGANLDLVKNFKEISKRISDLLSCWAIFRADLEANPWQDVG